MTTLETLTREQARHIGILASSDDAREHLADADIRTAVFYMSEAPDQHRQKIVGIMRAIERMQIEVNAICARRAGIK